MPELVKTLEAMSRKENRERKFAASLQNIELDENQEEESKSFDDIRRKALGIETSGDDVASLRGPLASEAGFGIGMGLGYTKVDG